MRPSCFSGPGFAQGIPGGREKSKVELLFLTDGANLWETCPAGRGNLMRKRSRHFLSPLLALIAATAWGQDSSSAKIWIDNPLAFEEFLRTADIVSVEDVGSGRNNPKQVTLKKGDQSHRAIWKPIQRGRQEWGWESYQAEVAAYQLDRLLGLGMVPPTVVRDIDGESGSLQLWVEGCKLFQDSKDEAPETVDWKRQLSRMRLFDSLISNGDRSAKNYMVDGQWNIVLIDHSQAFVSNEDLESGVSKLPEQFDRELVEKLRELDPMSLELHFDRLLMRPQVEAIEARRDALLAYVDKMVSEKGEANVYY
jgi:hypothetical protein